jgi:hypothetical protein
MPKQPGWAFHDDPPAFGLCQFDRVGEFVVVILVLISNLPDADGADDLANPMTVLLALGVQTLALVF